MEPQLNSRYELPTDLDELQALWKILSNVLTAERLMRVKVFADAPAKQRQKLAAIDAAIGAAVAIKDALKARLPPGAPQPKQAALMELEPAALARRPEFS
jgi:hypothetical protein